MPEQDGLAFRYRVKPALLAVMVFVGLFGTALVASGFAFVRVGQVVPGGILAAMGVVVLSLVLRSPALVVLDPDTLERRSMLGAATVLRLADLSHFEAVLIPRGKTTYYFRGTHGQSIIVNGAAFDAIDLLRRIQAMQPCPQQAYQRHHWYGG